jgi:hypothetical protein
MARMLGLATFQAGFPKRRFCIPHYHILPNLALDFGFRSFTECVSESSSPTPPKKRLELLARELGVGLSLSYQILKSPTT